MILRRVETVIVNKKRMTGKGGQDGGRERNDGIFKG